MHIRDCNDCSSGSNLLALLSDDGLCGFTEKTRKKHANAKKHIIYKHMDFLAEKTDNHMLSNTIFTD